MGGGMSNKEISYVNVKNCIFKNNNSAQGGGVANYFCGDSIIFSNCKFITNTSDAGGGMGNWNTRAYITDCLFDDNYVSGSTNYGSALYNWGGGSNSQIINCTFINNRAENPQGVIHSRGVTSTAINCILWDNDGADIVGSHTSGGGQTSLIVALNRPGMQEQMAILGDDPMYVIEIGKENTNCIIWALTMC